MKPKSLRQYINITEKEKDAVYDEFQELQEIALQSRPSQGDSAYTTLDRYTDIFARGSWSHSAIRLTGECRLHDYINANEIHGIRPGIQYIACQGPMRSTCEDFWDMIVQCGVTKIVMLTKLKEASPFDPSTSMRKCHSYFPSKSHRPIVFNRRVIKMNEMEYHPDLDLEIRHLLITDNGETHRVTHYYFMGWPVSGVCEPDKLLDLIDVVNQTEEHRPTTSIVIHCSGGTGRTGTYIAVEKIIHLLDQSSTRLAVMKLDVMSVVHQMRQDRARMVQTEDQYMLIHRCIEEHLRRTRRLHLVVNRHSLSTTSEDSYLDLTEDEVNHQYCYIRADDEQSRASSPRPPPLPPRIALIDRLNSE